MIATKQTLPLAALALSLLQPASAAYDLIVSHAGASFFDGWTFATGYDNTTNGDVFWKSDSNVAYVDNAGRAILKVDNVTDVPYNEKRNSVKLYSKNYYRPGTVWVMDASHVPVGCSVWPALFTQGTKWPEHGEIDIFEVVNNESANQYALHTTAGCTASPNATLGQSGTAGPTSCNQAENSGSGCTVRDGNRASAGEGFNANGGGVYVAAFETSGINIWFFSRDSIPAALGAAADNIDLTTLGTPSASYSGSTCDINRYFGSQQLTLDITLCGDFAGGPTILEQTCPALIAPQTCYTTYVLDSRNYDRAYFEINYLNVYGTSDSIDPELSTGGQASVTRSSSSAVQTQTATRSGASRSMTVTGTTTGAGGNTLPTQTPNSGAGSLNVAVWIGGAAAVVAAWGLL
ncbi:hypothetical protein NliqN6_5498 [Naganishia liquefaciens]|uniref:GH16 domain-containing protein n=1 Tax=Naganishia liquefaciens TaxID=104408 RepID=A0A8H3YJ14_9TREE|nr:hypothetical protein NliqN6_5498 [Naganishia liquefaciens]